uniref:Uncharacterized protein n=1 Tax=Tanacetum cinerariifolium TaxID=118510 RepID=A0A6L2JPB0_TANCI|nr:hypothetical protein [Tanacetum cinerariifolium]
MCGIQIIVRKKVNSGYVVENVLMGCGGAYTRNERDKREGLCENELRLEEGFEENSGRIFYEMVDQLADEEIMVPKFDMHKIVSLMMVDEVNRVFEEFTIP